PSAVARLRNFFLKPMLLSCIAGALRTGTQTHWYSLSPGAIATGHGLEYRCSTLSASEVEALRWSTARSQEIAAPAAPSDIATRHRDVLRVRLGHSVMTVDIAHRGVIERNRCTRSRD